MVDRKLYVIVIVIAFIQEDQNDSFYFHSKSLNILIVFYIALATVCSNALKKSHYTKMRKKKLRKNLLYIDSVLFTVRL